MQPDGPGLIDLLCIVLMAVHAFWQQYPVPKAGQQRPEEDSFGSDSDSWVAEPAADEHPSPVAPQDQQLPALRDRLFEQLSGPPGKLMAITYALGRLECCVGSNCQYDTSINSSMLHP
jgi:hypothetical protein